MMKCFYKLLIAVLLVNAISGCGRKTTDTSVIKEKEVKQINQKVEKALTVEEKIALTESVLEPLPSKEEAEAMEEVCDSKTTLNVPTDAEKVDGLYFIVDCYNDQVIYSDNLDTPLPEWHVMCNEISRGHTIASDGTVYLIDDTENNRVLVYQKEYGKFIHTQTINNVGKRPHYVRYDDKTNAFYVLSSMTGEIFVLRSTPAESAEGDIIRQEISVSDIITIEVLTNTYCRSFSIAGDKIWFPASNGLIVEATFPECVPVKMYQAPSAVAGLAQIYPIGSYFYLTVSTNAEGSQDNATLIRTKNLEALQRGQYEDMYDTLEPDKTSVGTPYHISSFDNHYYMVEHRHGHGLFQFNVEDDQMVEIQILQ